MALNVNHSQREFDKFVLTADGKTAVRVTDASDESITGRSVSFEDSSFEAGDSPATWNVFDYLGREGSDGYVVCDGAGSFTVSFSDDGTNYGSAHTLKRGEQIILKGINVNEIKLTHSGTDSGYRIFVI